MSMPHLSYKAGWIHNISNLVLMFKSRINTHHISLVINKPQINTTTTNNNNNNINNNDNHKYIFVLDSLNDWVNCTH